MDMAWLGFFYLMRPGEYTKSSDNKPLLFQDIMLAIGGHVLAVPTCAIPQLHLATRSSVEFDDQKKRERGEVIAHGISGHTEACPTRALARRLAYLRSTSAAPTTPLCGYKKGNRWHYVSSAQITALLRRAATANPAYGILPANISARSLRAGGAMALLCGKVDTDTIKLVGRWRSDAMFRYLHAQAIPIVRNLASTMLNHGVFSLTPGASEPIQAHAMLGQD